MEQITFINHSKDDHDPRKDRSAINSHVNKLLSRRRRKDTQRAAEAQSTVLFPVLFQSPVTGWVLHGGSVKQVVAGGDNGNKVCLLGTQKKSRGACCGRKNHCSCCLQGTESIHKTRGDTSTRTPQPRPNTEQKPICFRRYSPDSILKKGNSDPFDTFSIKVNSVVNYLLSFNREVFIPHEYRKRKDVPRNKNVVGSYFPDTPLTLNEDICHGYGGLAQTAAIVASMEFADGKMADIAMALKSRATTILDARITLFNQTQANMQTLGRSGTGSDTQLLTSICKSVNRLMSAEIAVKNYAAASVHGNMLRRFLQASDHSMRVSLDPLHLYAILYQDVNRASISLSRPIFDLELWAADYLSCPDTLPNIDPTPAAPVDVRPLDRSVTSPIQRDFFMKIRRGGATARFLWSLPQEHQMRWRSQDSGIAAAVIHNSAWNRIYEGQLVNLYLDAPKGNTLDSAQGVFLAIIYWFRLSLLSETYAPGSSKFAQAGTTVYDTGPAILRELNTIVARELECAGDVEADPFSLTTPDREEETNRYRLRLWVTYVGALIERAPTNSPRSSTNFQRMFVKETVAQGYRSWEDVRDSLLRGFLYVDGMDTQADEWFEQAIRRQVLTDERNSRS